MYCGECGAKIEKDAAFCGECGAPVSKESKPSKKDSKSQSHPQDSKFKKENKEELPMKTRKPLTKMQKVLIVVIAVVVVGLFTGYKVLENHYSPKTVAKDYISALFERDADRLYSYLNLSGDTKFVSKKEFKKAIEKSDSTKIKNYKIGDVIYDTGKLSATVTVHYTEEGSSTEKTDKITLVKEKEKELLIFDRWSVNTDSASLVVKDYKLIVPKGAKVVLGEISLTDEYLHQKASDETTDVYTIPQIFTKEISLKVTLVNGMVIEDTITPSAYYSTHTVELDISNLSDQAVKQLEDQMKTSLSVIYNALIENKNFADIESSFQYPNSDLTALKEDYEEVLEDFKDSSTVLKEINFTSIDLSSIDSEEDVISIRAKVNYNYKIEYKSYLNDEIETKDGKDYTYVTLKYVYVDGKYQLVGAERLVSYFSRY